MQFLPFCPRSLKITTVYFYSRGGRGRVQNWTRSKNAGWTSRKCELSHSWLNFGRILAPISTRRVGSGQPGTIPSSPARLPSSPVRFQWLQPATRDRILPCYQSEMLPVGEDPARQFCFNHSLLDFLPPGRENAKIIELEYLANDSLFFWIVPRHEFNQFFPSIEVSMVVMLFLFFFCFEIKKILAKCSSYM